MAKKNNPHNAIAAAAKKMITAPVSNNTAEVKAAEVTEIKEVKAEAKAEAPKAEAKKAEEPKKETAKKAPAKRTAAKKTATVKKTTTAKKTTKKAPVKKTVKTSVLTPQNSEELQAAFVKNAEPETVAGPVHINEDLPVYLL